MSATARARVEGEASRLSDVRQSHHQTAVTQTNARHEMGESDDAVERVVDQVHRELKGTLPQTPQPQAAQGLGRLETAPAPGTTTGAPEPVTDDQRAQQALALIERIELFVRSSRPAIALTLNNSLGARVELERLGPREIAVTLIGHLGPPSPETVGRIREELRSRGLKVSALQVA